MAEQHSSTPSSPRVRTLSWEGFYNARDLGGFETVDGGRTRVGAVIRAGTLAFVTPEGWDALLTHGVRTILDLRNDDERRGDAYTAPVEVTTLHVSLDDAEDTVLWEHFNSEKLNGSPLYYPMFLERKPERCAAVISAIAHAAPGGVLIHCGAGRDRTGLIAMLLLALLQVTPDEIAADYDLSTVEAAPLFRRAGRDDEGPQIRQLLESRGTTTTAALLETLASFAAPPYDIATYLRQGGVTENELQAVRRRLLEE